MGYIVIIIVIIIITILYISKQSMKNKEEAILNEMKRYENTPNKELPSACDLQRDVLLGKIQEESIYVKALLREYERRRENNIYIKTKEEELESKKIREEEFKKIREEQIEKLKEDHAKSEKELDLMSKYPTSIINEIYQLRIVEILRFYQEAKTIEQIKLSSKHLSELSNQKLSALLKRLVDNGVCTKFVEKKQTWFSVIDEDSIYIKNIESLKEEILNKIYSSNNTNKVIAKDKDNSKINNRLNGAINQHESDSQNINNLQDAINNISKLTENLLKDSGMDLEEYKGMFEVGNMKKVEGRGFSIDIPENYNISRGVDGKEIIAYEEGYDEYVESPLHIQVGIQYLEQNISEEQFVQIMKNYFDNMNVKYNVLDINGNKATVTLQEGMFGVPIYHIAIYNEDHYYQLRITFNSSFDNVEEVRNMIMNSFKTIDNYDEYEREVDEDIERQKKELVGPDGKISALYLAELLQKDVIFFNEGEIGFDGTKHFMKGIQFNSAVIHDYVVVANNAQAVANELNDVVSVIEDNEKLRVKLDDIDESLHGFLLNEDMTAFTFMNLFTYKLLILSKKEDSSIVVMADTRVTSGILNGQELIKELVKSLLEYNEIYTSNIEITVIGMRNFDI